MRHRYLMGALGLAAAAPLALAGTASAHPNLEIRPAVTCAGASFTATGVEGGNVTAASHLELTNQANQDRTTILTPADNGVAKPAGTVPTSFVGHYFLRVSAEGQTTSVQGDLDCRPSLPPPSNFTPPPPPPPPPTCGELRRLYPKAGPARVRSWEQITGVKCTVTPPPPPPPGRVRYCEHPAKLRIVQQQTGTFYTQTYPLRIIIANTTGAATPAGALVLTDSGLQNFVAPDGSRTERLVVPVGPMRNGGKRVIDRTMGFVGVEAFREVFTTYATFHVNGRVCGYTLDRAFEG